MSIRDILEQLDEEERLLYLSAVQVRDSAFWKHLVVELNELSDMNKGALLTKTMQADEKGALIAACKIQALGFVKEKLDSIIDEVTILALNQEQEEENA